MNFIKHPTPPFYARILTFLFLVLCAQTGYAQDSRWLKSWNEALASMPEQLLSRDSIVSAHEKGIPFIIQGTVYNPDGSLATGVIVHAYHRDAKGYDFGPGDSTTSTWRLQGWAQTDESGQFEFISIRPAPDHLGRGGAHIHFTIVSTKYGRQWAPTVFLADDPMVPESKRTLAGKKGKFTDVCGVREIDGIQYINIHVKLKEKGDF